MPIRAASDWPACSESRRTRTRPPRAVDSAAGSAVTTATASTPCTRRSEVSTSENIACASAWREPAPSPPAKRCLAAPKVFTGRIAIVLIEGPEWLARGERDAIAGHLRALKGPRKLQGLPGEATRLGHGVHRRIRHECPQVRYLLVGHHPVEHVSVGSRDPGRAQLDVRVCAERLRRSLE